MYLLDTNVVSELRKQRPHGAVVAWIESVPDLSLFVSAATFGELQTGVERTRVDDPAKAAEIEEWIDQLDGVFRVLPIDAAISRERSRLLAHRSLALYEDATIAATARIHRLTVVTRNVKDLKVFDVPLLNPFSIPKLH